MGDAAARPVLGGLGDRSTSPRHFLTVGSETSAVAAIPATVSPLSSLLPISSILSTPIVSLQDLLMSKTYDIDNRRPTEAVGVNAAVSDNFPLPDPKGGVYPSRILIATKHTGVVRGRFSTRTVRARLSAQGTRLMLYKVKKTMCEPGIRGVVCVAASAAGPTTVLEMAHARGYVGSGAILHSDRDSQHASPLTAGRAASHDMRLSVDCTGSCHDNAVADPSSPRSRTRCTRCVPGRPGPRPSTWQWGPSKGTTTGSAHPAIGYQIPAERA